MDAKLIVGLVIAIGAFLLIMCQRASTCCSSAQPCCCGNFQGIKCVQLIIICLVFLFCQQCHLWQWCRWCRRRQSRLQTPQTVKHHPENRHVLKTICSIFNVALMAHRMAAVIQKINAQVVVLVPAVAVTTKAGVNTKGPIHVEYHAQTVNKHMLPIPHLKCNYVLMVAF